MNLFDKDLTSIYAIASYSRYVSRKLFVLYAIATLDQPTMVDIQEATKISRAALSRILRELRTEDGINITHPKGRDGYYVIESWGNLDADEFLGTFKTAAKNFRNPEIKK